MRTKSWLTRIPLILQHLATDAQAVYTRAEVERLFIIGRSQAADLMKVAGAQVRNGAEATVSRDNLRFYVERCPEAAACLAELERRKLVAERLKQTSEELSLKATPIPDAKPADEWTRWRDLPNVALEPGMMRIMYVDRRDLLHTLWLISRACLNEPKEFATMCGEQPEPPRKKRRPPAAETTAAAEGEPTNAH